jgi:Cof subfamily protein (haloacid dehalogenase superfamily)
MKYGLVAIDLDGTVLGKDGAIVAGAKDAVQRLLDRGTAVTLATGRMYQPSNRYAAELNITAPLICYQGALIREPAHGDILWHKPLPVSLARRIISEIRREGVHQYAYVDGSIFVEHFREDDVRYSLQNGAELHRVDDLTMTLDMPPTEIAARGTPEEIDRVTTRIRSCCGAEVIVNKVHASFCEIAHVGSGKGNALRYLAERLDITQSRTVAIGDSPNDVSMLRWAGLGIVVGDAPEEVSAAADWVVDKSGGDSFCEAIARLLDDGGPRA